MTIKGVIFDMDGVVTNTAITHFTAWKIVIEQFLGKLKNTPMPFKSQSNPIP
jgi:alpha,alpha-trehalase